MELLSLLPSLLLVQLFRRTRQRYSDQEKLSAFYETLRKIKRCPTSTVHSKTQKRLKFTFPWWCIFLAYSLSFIMAGVALFFIIARGIEFGDLKTQAWLTSLIIGFCSSLCLTQPLKVRGVHFLVNRISHCLFVDCLFGRVLCLFLSE